MEACQRLRFTEFDSYRVEMAVDEACTNIIEYGYHGEVPAGQEIDHPGVVVVYSTYSDHLVIEITDHGDGFDFDEKLALDPAHYLIDDDEPGLGIYIIKRFVDSVDYHRDPLAGNRLRLTKNR